MYKAKLNLNFKILVLEGKNLMSFELS